MHRLQIQVLVDARIFFQIGPGEFEQRRRRTQVIFLQMHERARELDQTLVKISVRAVAVRKPQIFENVVRLVKKLAVEAIEIAAVMRVEISPAKLFDHRGDAFALAAHGFRVKSNARSPKAKVPTGCRGFAGCKMYFSNSVILVNPVQKTQNVPAKRCRRQFISIRW
jgi:hypothetical protein